MNIFSRHRRHDDDLPPPATHGDGMSGGGMAHNNYQGDGYHNAATYGSHTGRHNGPLDNNFGTSGHHNATSNAFGHHNHGHHIGPMDNNYAPTNGQHGNVANAYDNRTNGHHIPRTDTYDNRNNGHHNDHFHDGKHNNSHRGRGGGGLLQRRRNKSRNSRPLFDLETGNFNRRPSFGQWLKMTWLDLVTMAAMGAVGLGVYMADPAPSRSFPITFNNGEIVFPQFAYPLRNEIIPIWAAALMAALIPIFIFLVMQIRIRSFWDVNNAIIGLLYSLISAAVFQVFIKWLIGGLRPHFLAVCDPDPSIASAAEGSGNGFQNIMFDRSICRGERSAVNDALESFPSGHSTAAFAGFMFLYFYLNAKLKVFSNYHPAMWKLLATYAPVLGATLIAGAMTIDEFHHWYDVGFGAIIGSVMAISAYRMVYASVWDFRFNHIPLTRHTPFSYGAGAAGAGGFETTVFTRKAGWGYEEAFGGAPNDAAYHLRGQVAGFNTGVHSHSRKEKTGAGVTGHSDGGLTNGHGRDRDDWYRHGDVEHNAATTTATSGVGRTTPSGVGAGHAGVNGTGHGLTTNETGRDAGRPGHGIGDGIGRDTGRFDDTAQHSRPGVTGNPDGGNWGYPEGAGEQNRYRQHRKSIERKAVPT